MKILWNAVSKSNRGMVGPRGRNILHTGAWSLIAKGCAAANLIISVPYVLHALGPVQFGAWATLVSFVVFAGFLDFGFGNGTMNLLAAAKGRDNLAEIEITLREGNRMLRRVALWLAGATLLALPIIPWHRLLGMPDSMAGVSRASAGVVLTSIVLAIPLNLATRAQLGLGRGGRAFRWQALSQILALLAVIVCTQLEASLPVLTAAAVTTPLLGSLANTLDMRRMRHASITEVSDIQHNEIARKISHEGVQFFILQLAAALAFSADLPLISALRGPVDAGSYAVVQRFFSVIPLGLSLLWVPLWPMYRQALAAGDHIWVTRTLRRSLFLAVLSAGACAAMLALGFNQLISLWVHKPPNVSSKMLAGFAAWSTLDALGGALGTFLNAASIMRYQVVIAIVFGVSCVAAKIFVLHSMALDLLPWTTAVVYSATCLLPLSLLFPRIVRMTTAKQY